MDKATNKPGGRGDVPFGMHLDRLESQPSVTKERARDDEPTAQAHTVVGHRRQEVKQLTVMTALIRVIWRISILSVVPLGARRRLSLRYGLLGAHLGVHVGGEDGPSAKLSPKRSELGWQVMVWAAEWIVVGEKCRC